MTPLLFLLLWLVVGTEVAISVQQPQQQVLWAKQDSVADLSKVWVLRERYVQQEEELVLVRPVPKYILSLRPDKTYRLIQENEIPNAVNGEEVIEEGVWELEEEHGYIGVTITQVDGRAIRSTLAYRWQIAGMSAGKLVLSTIATGAEVLVFEEKGESAFKKL